MHTLIPTSFSTVIATKAGNPEKLFQCYMSQFRSVLRVPGTELEIIFGVHHFTCQGMLDDSLFLHYCIKSSVFRIYC